MAQEQVNVNEELLQHYQKFPGPTPGQSLTNSVDPPSPWDGPTTYTNMNDALDSLFDMLTEEEMLVNLVVSISDGAPITAITQMILIDGFQKGSWNPDLMVSLIEPTMYMIMSIAEKAGIKYRIDEDDDPDTEEATPEEELKMINKLIDVSSKKIRNSGKRVNIPSKILTSIKELEMPASLLGKVKVESSGVEARAEVGVVEEEEAGAEVEEPQQQETNLLEQRG